MLQMRLHVFMGTARLSLWCHSHGDPHCLWSGSQTLDEWTPEALLLSLADAGVYTSERAHLGTLPDLTDECGL